MMEIKALGQVFNVDINMNALACDDDIDGVDEKVRAALAPAFDAITESLCGMVALIRLLGEVDDDEQD